MFAEHHNWVFYLLFMHMGNLCYELKSLGVNERGCLRDLSICGCFSQVQAVLLLLGGYEIPSGIPSMGPVPLNQQVCTYIYIYIYLCINHAKVYWNVVFQLVLFSFTLSR